MKKSLTVFILTICVFISYIPMSFAESQISVTIDGVPVEFDVQPQIINDRIMVPMRAIFEALDCDVQWIEENQLIIAIKNELIISMMIGKVNMPVQNLITNESSIVKLDSPPVIVDDRTLVPVRAITEALGANVEWIQETSSVVITSNANEQAGETGEDM